MHFSIKGLVIRETKLKESDKILTVLTKEYGKISVYAHGVRSFKSKYMKEATLLSYSNFILAKKGNYLTLCEASIIENFPGAQYDLTLYSLCQYIVDVAGELSLYDTPDEEILPLTLNTLWALCNTKTDKTQIKCAYELRIMTIAGFMPDIDGCTVCSENDDEMIFDIMNAQLYCRKCIGNEEEHSTENELFGTANILKTVSRETLEAMRYIICSPPKRIFSFTVSGETLFELTHIAESYLLNHIGHGFSTLNFYKETSRLD